MANDKVKVSISRDCVVTSSHPLPPVLMIAQHLSTKEKQNLARAASYDCRQDFARIVKGTESTISHREWADAACKAILFLRENNGPAESEMVGAETGYLCIGNLVFRMSAEDYVAGGQRALPVLRRRVLAEAKAEAQRIVEAGRVEGERLQERATTKYLEKMQQLVELRKECAQLSKTLANTIPSWADGHEILFRANRDCLSYGVYMGFKLLCFYHKSPDGTKHIWSAAPIPSVPMLLWFTPNRATGGWDAKDVTSDLYTPHVGARGSCLTLAQMPTITSGCGLLEAANIVRNVIAETNLDSPLYIHAEWAPQVKAFVPEKLKGMMKNWDEGGPSPKMWCERNKETADIHVPPEKGGEAMLFGAGAAEFTAEG